MTGHSVLYLGHGDFASDYGEKLEAYSQRLGEARRVSDIHAIIGSLIEAGTYPNRLWEK